MSRRAAVVTQKPRVQILVVVANVQRVPCEPEAPTRHTDAQPVMPIGLSQIGRAVVCRVLAVLAMGVTITPPDPPGSVKRVLMLQTAAYNVPPRPSCPSCKDITDMQPVVPTGTCRVCVWGGCLGTCFCIKVHFWLLKTF